MTSKVRGIRGAITVSENSMESIIDGTETLLKVMIEKNNVINDEICSIFFSVTNDLNKTFPAKGARTLGLVSTPLLCLNEIPIEGDLPFCIRILIHYNTDATQNEIQHIYLRNAKKLRPDLKS